MQTTNLDLSSTSPTSDARKKCWTSLSNTLSPQVTRDDALPRVSEGGNDWADPCPSGGAPGKCAPSPQTSAFQFAQ